MKFAFGNFSDTRRYFESTSRSEFLVPLAAIGLAVIFGGLSSLMPPLILLIALVGIVMTCFSVARPYIGLLAILILVFEVVPVDYQPGFGKLRAYDAMVVFLTAVVMLRTLAKGESVLKSLGSMVWPVTYLVVALTVSFLYVKYYAPNDSALSEGRSQFMWLMLPLVTLGIDSRERFKHFIVGTMAIGAVVALYVFIESIFGVKILSPGDVQPLDVYGNSDIVRSMAGGGTYIVILAFFLCINLMLERRLSWLFGAPLSLLLCLGVALQYGRGTWIAMALGMMLSAWIHRGWGGLFKLAVIGAAIVALLVGGMAIVKPRVAEALVERATGIGNEIESGGSFGFRKMENRYASVAISKHPILGVGIGGQYKPTATAGGGFNNETTYIHNSWLWFPLKMGLWAALIPVVFIFCFAREIRRGLKRWAGHEKGASWFAGAVAGAFVVPVVTSYTQPEWAAPQGIAALAVLMGCALLYVRWGSPLQVFSRVERQVQR